MMDGIILVNKPLNCTSHDVVNRLRRVLHTKKVGHCGTLDPLASGVLVVCVNKATKAIQFLSSEDKTYIATIRLGMSTDTYDLEGKVVETKEFKNDITLEKLNEVIQSFLGKQKQIPPIYSAIKVNGKKLYEYARNGEVVEIEPRDIEIIDLKVLDFKDNEIKILAHCSKGTYIRSLCVDIATALGYPGCMSSLVRIQSGPFKLEDSYSIEQIENNEFKIISIHEALNHLPSLMIEDENLVIHGKQIKSDLKGQVVIKNNQSKVLAIYEQTGKGWLKNVRGLW